MNKKSPNKNNKNSDAFFNGDMSEKADESFGAGADEYYGLGGVTKSYYTRNQPKKKVVKKAEEIKPGDHYITYKKPVIEPVPNPKMPSEVNLPAKYALTYEEEQSFEA